VQNLKGTVLSEANLRRLNEELQLYPDLEGDESAMLKRLRRDIVVSIVTTTILDPRTGREREVVDAFTLSYDNRVPAKAQKGAQWLVAAFLAEHRRQKQGGQLFKRLPRFNFQDDADILGSELLQP
jgi:hypothetical protein